MDRGVYNLIVCRIFFFLLGDFLGGAVASWLVCLTPQQAIWVQALAGDIVLCSWAIYLTLTVPFSRGGACLLHTNLYTCVYKLGHCKSKVKDCPRTQGPH